MTLALGQRSVRDCQAAVSSSEFAEWMAFYQLQPFGEQRMDMRFAMLAALVANLLTDSRKKHWKPEDFMPDFEKALEDVEREAESTPVTVADKVKAFFGMMAAAGKKADGKPTKR